jgi:hypothetical protein
LLSTGEVLTGERLFTYTMNITNNVMSRHQTIKIIRRELDKVNQDIDLKIIKGLSYVKEARRYRFLMSQLRHIAPYRSWFKRSFGFIALFS